MIPKLLCVCNQIILPARRWLVIPKTVTCPGCSLSISVEATAPGNAEACFKAAEDFAESQVYERAIALASIGLAIVPSSTVGRFVRAFALDKAGKEILAIADWTACIEGNYRRSVALLKRAQAYKSRQEHAKALTDYESLLAGDPAAELQLKNQISRIHLGRAQTLCDVGEYARAIAEYSRLLDGDLSSVRERERITKYQIYEARGITFCRAGLFAEARQDLNIVLPHSASGGMTSYWLLVCQYQGDETRARNEWSKT